MDGVPTESYDYDANGNRLQVDRGASAGDVAMYDDQDRLNVYDRRGEVYSYEYDANGDLLSKTGPEGVTSYQYDLLGALQWVMLPDGTEIEYVLDPAGRRIGKKVNGVLEWGLLYQDDLNPAAQLDGDGNLVSAFVYGTRPNIPDYFTQNGRVYRIVADHLGSPRLVIDAADGTVAERIDYGPWGQVTRHDITGPAGYVPIPFTFAGGIGDIDTGLVRFGARDYDPMTGRWTNKDPIRFNGGDANLYGYVLGDPNAGIDPLGLWYEDFNLSGGFWGGITVGVQLNRSGIYPYVGGGLVTPGAGVSYTLSPSTPSTGWNVGFQAQAGLAAQVGYSFGKDGGLFFEGGGGYPPGASLTGYYVFEPWCPWCEDKTKSYDGDVCEEE